MKRFWTFAAMAVMSVGLAAQTPPPSSQSPTTPRSSDDKKITVTGCIQKAEPSATATGTSGAASASEAKFVLNNVSSGAGASATAGTAGSTRTAPSYRLDAADSKLSPHVGHKVEISGTVEKEGGSTSTATSMPSSASAAPKLKVDTVKMISSSCTPE
jgi:hypothetical protein